jgi:hypothetical protein
MGLVFVTFFLPALLKIRQERNEVLQLFLGIPKPTVMQLLLKFQINKEENAENLEAADEWNTQNGELEVDEGV